MERRDFQPDEHKKTEECCRVFRFRCVGRTGRAEKNCLLR